MARDVVAVLSRLPLPLVAFLFHAAVVFLSLWVWPSLVGTAGGLLYPVALVMGFTRLFSEPQRPSPPLETSVVTVHIAISIVLYTFGYTLHFPGLGGAVAYVFGPVAFVFGFVAYASLLAFFVINTPGILVGRLLPYAVNESELMSLSRAAVTLCATAAWMWVAIRTARLVSDRFPPALERRPGAAKRLGLMLFAAIGVGGAVLWLRSFDPYYRHFWKPLPASAKLLHSDEIRHGGDVSYAFVFEIEDDRLLDQLIGEWGLEFSDFEFDEPKSIVAQRPPSWWPGPEQLRSLPIQWGSTDGDEAHYRSVWVDSDARRLYAEYGE